MAEWAESREGERKGERERREGGREEMWCVWWGPRDSEELRANQTEANQGRWMTAGGRERGGPGIEDCSTGPPATEINGDPLPLRDARAAWILCPWGNPLCWSLCSRHKHV